MDAALITALLDLGGVGLLIYFGWRQLQTERKDRREAVAASESRETVLLARLDTQRAEMTRRIEALQDDRIREMREMLVEAHQTAQALSTVAAAFNDHTPITPEIASGLLAAILSLEETLRSVEKTLNGRPG